MKRILFFTILIFIITKNSYSEKSAKELYLYGMQLFDDSKHEENITFYFDSLIASANKEYPPAIHQLGKLFFEGNYVERDIDKGIGLLRLAGDLDYVPSLLYIAELARKSDNKEMVIKYYKKAALLGSTEGMKMLGIVFVDNNDYFNGISYLEDAVKNGNETSSSFLANAYYLYGSQILEEEVTDKESFKKGEQYLINAAKLGLKDIAEPVIIKAAVRYGSRIVKNRETKKYSLALWLLTKAKNYGYKEPSFDTLLTKMSQEVVGNASVSKGCRDFVIFTADAPGPDGLDGDKLSMSGPPEVRVDCSRNECKISGWLGDCVAGEYQFTYYKGSTNWIGAHGEPGSWSGKLYINGKHLRCDITIDAFGVNSGCY